MVPQRRSPQPVRPDASAETAARLPLWAWLGGAAGLAAAAGASGALVWQHFSGKSLPGCGPQSGCASIENHLMGKVPLPGFLAEIAGFAAWPTSFLGFTFFLAMLAWWLWAGRVVTLPMRAMVWAGIVASIVFLAAIVAKLSGGGEACRYCLASHAANFAMLACMEVGMVLSRRWAMVSGAGAVKWARGGVLAATAVFVAATGALGAFEHRKVAAEAAASEAARAEAERALIEQAKAARNQPAPTQETWNFGPRGFTGRFREGPEQAVARIVIFSDYQCTQCKRIENEARALQQKYPDKVSVSHKHYPWASACNKYLNGQTLHANACWAARAAEAAGLLKGNEGFWEMHYWLFGRGGGFTDQELNDGLAQLGYDPKVFIAVMTGEGTLRSVEQDVDEAQALGISGTPMVFINGVELKGWEAARALERTVEAVLNSGAQPATSASDRPVLAREKYIADWRDETARPNAGVGRRELKNGDGRVEVVVFGDLFESNTAKVDAMLREWAAKPVEQGGKPIRYVYRHFPFDKACNPSVQKTFFENSCLAAQAAEAAAVVGGPDAAWRMQEWLMKNPKGFGVEAARRAAGELGLDADAIVAAMNGAEAQGAVSRDVNDARMMGLNLIPAVHVNGKLVRRWTREGDNVLERIIDEAAAK